MSKKSAKPKPPIAIIRDIKDISNEYGQVCGKAGEAQFKMKALEGELNTHNQRLVELHREHNEAVKKQEQRVKEETPVVP